MPEFRPKVLRTVTLEQFWPEQKPWPLNVRADAGSHVVWNELHQSYIKLKPGDWVRVDTPGDTYPIDWGYLKENYEQVN